ncbi:MAG: nucleotide exchange factor GrpE [Candidatus Fraserbacteria bacterium RBG_16_55_9]|uniref:Protein GrpE n=1 Tax=Fraserbacteria sp. (strain RBG_16_55_9) TaxID=1817864 RepID=A0A1F5V1E0_FRAXR|nr:MAG: nucleotide exchange factor GrpE [Candidatus Fraserbacteria bacterium RBG_16_55_9]
MNERESKEVQAPTVEEQLKAYIDRLQRLQADFENYKKRVAREQEEYASWIENRLLLKLLPLYDSCERAIRSYDHNSDKDSFVEGMKRVFAQFNDFLKSHDVQAIAALGQPFDPSLHEALLLVETDEKPSVVLDEFERGYRRGDRLLRPSRVKVSRRRQGAMEDSPLTEAKEQIEGGNS